MEMESEGLKKSLKMCQVMHMGEPAMCVSSLGAVPAPGGDCKTLASACRLSQRRIALGGSEREKE